MPHRSAETATYPGEMAKVELDLPDDLLRQVDRVAGRRGETRDEFLRRVAESEVDRSNAQWIKEIEQMMGPPRRGGGNWGWWMNQDRRHRDDKRWGPDERFGPDERGPDER